MLIDLSTVKINLLTSLSHGQVNTAVLRLDELHSVVSGNKWFKLRFYLEEAQELGKTTIASFGGAYSNHIAALAYSCKELGLHSVGFIRGENTISPTLKAATEQGMQLHFVNSELYKYKNQIKKEFAHKDWYFINEGGYGKTGAKGAATILDIADFSKYTHIIGAVGTGTMLAGMVLAALPHQKIIGISVLKNNFSLAEEIASLLPEEKKHAFSLLHDYHFGGYAKHPTALINFMNNLFEQEQLPTDIVYTGKLLYAVTDLLNHGYFGATANVLMIHSGGLQGNQSLPKGTLIF